MVEIYETAKVSLESTVRGPGSARIGDFVLVNSHIEMGEGSMIHAHSEVVGGGWLHVGRHALVGYGNHIFTGSNDPSDRNRVVRSGVWIGDHVFTGPGVTLMPGSVIPSGCCIGAGGYIPHGKGILKEWTIYYPVIGWVENPRERFV